MRETISYIVIRGGKQKVIVHVFNGQSSVTISIGKKTINTFPESHSAIMRCGTLTEFPCIIQETQKKMY